MNQLADMGVKHEAAALREEVCGVLPPPCGRFGRFVLEHADSVFDLDGVSQRGFFLGQTADDTTGLDGLRVRVAERQRQLQADPFLAHDEWRLARRDFDYPDSKLAKRDHRLATRKVCRSADRAWFEPHEEPPAFFVGERANGDHDQIDQRPDAESAKREQLEEPGADFIDVEPVDAQGAEEETQQQRD